MAGCDVQESKGEVSERKLMDEQLGNAIAHRLGTLKNPDKLTIGRYST